MTAFEAFIDSNILLYLLSSDANKADQAEEILQAGGVISVQVLNEITNVTRRKLSMSWKDINEILAIIASICQTEPITIETHNLGKLTAERYGISVYDSMIVASALLAGCKTLYSEDMQHGMIIDQQLRICNPFIASNSSN